jgi:hypothetical protein
MSESLRPGATQRAFDPKIEEYFQFCDTIYSQDVYCYNLSYDKVYRFMFYVTFRNNKTKGGTKESWKARRDAVKNGIHFDVDDYQSVVAQFRVAPGTEITKEHWPKPQFPISLLNFDQYKAVFRKIYKVQIAKRVLSTTGITFVKWASIVFANMLLIKHPKPRKKAMLRS